VNDYDIPIGAKLTLKAQLLFNNLAKRNGYFAVPGDGRFRARLRVNVYVVFLPVPRQFAPGRR
jgi:hypothetical protein